MKTLIVSVLLAMLPLAGVAYVVISGNLFTVDGLFTSLMLLTISGVFGLNAAMDLHSARSAAAGASSVGANTGAAAQPGARVETGAIRALQFFEAHVGEQNKTLVEYIPDGSTAARFISFIGNVRDQLPVGTRVRMIYRADADGNVLLEREPLQFGGRPVRTA